jgi:hypothetical protein
LPRRLGGLRAAYELRLCHSPRDTSKRSRRSERTLKAELVSYEKSCSGPLLFATSNGCYWGTLRSFGCRIRTRLHGCCLIWSVS